MMRIMFELIEPLRSIDIVLSESNEKLGSIKEVRKGVFQFFIAIGRKPQLSAFGPECASVETACEVVENYLK